jgi:SAM-dependent methyltransferase
MEIEQRSADWWDARYLSGDIPWDTGIVPPEVVALVASGLLTPGWALDLGCGSGLSSRYLAAHGFRVVGVDLAHSPLARGCRAAQADGLPAYFCRGDVSSLAFMAVQATFALDVGCFHAVPPARRCAYVASLAEHLLPGACYLLYAFAPYPDGGEGGDDLTGIGPVELAGFAPLFSLRWAQHGDDRGRPSAWYLLQRTWIQSRLH